MRLSQDLPPHWIFVKGALFAVILAMSTALIILESRMLMRTLLAPVVIWSSARLYYFMFYVIERYIEPNYKFAGIYSCIQYFWRQRQSERPTRSLKQAQSVQRP